MGGFSSSIINFNSNRRMARRTRRMIGGIKENVAAGIMAQPVGDLNRFYNYYLEDALKDTDVRATSVPVGDTITNSIMVIDMQYDFVEPHPAGAFSVAGGNNVVKPLVEWVQANANNCTKVILTRDFHDPTHCSFFTSGTGGPFPPHCVIDTPGAAFDKGIMPLKDLNNVEVIFKGMDQNTDSFGALTYPDDAYSAGRQAPGCCKGSEFSACTDATGGFYLEGLSKDDIFDIAPFAKKTGMRKFKLDDLLNGNETEHNVFVVGLAGDYCVRDTALNIAKMAPNTHPGIKFNVFVVQPLTRYAFVPLAVGYPPVTPDTLAQGKNNSGKRKDLIYYAFKYGASGPEIISAAEAASITDEQIKNMGSGYMHFLTDPRHIIEGYRATGVKVLMDIPTLQAAPAAPVAPTGSSVGGRRRAKTRRVRRNKRAAAKKSRKSRR